MTPEELRENRRLLQIEAKCVKLENILLKLIQEHREDVDNWKEAEEFERELLK
ncbi:hypothetical protein LCGC14_2416470 [marine sediment metagenome]|uniref:Uncharacterized protein n=1 Tax=marine sediment metagenome TaxID=412755 RepID=A0A0F9E349_9ZZZZ